jgi:hypothetical protein
MSTDHEIEIIENYKLNESMPNFDNIKNFLAAYQILEKKKSFYDELKQQGVLETSEHGKMGNAILSAIEQAKIKMIGIFKAYIASFSPNIDAQALQEFDILQKISLLSQILHNISTDSQLYSFCLNRLTEFLSVVAKASFSRNETVTYGQFKDDAVLIGKTICWQIKEISCYYQFLTCIHITSDQSESTKYIGIYSRKGSSKYNRPNM